MKLEEAKNLLLTNKIIFPLSKGSVGFKVNPFFVRRGVSLEEELQKYPDLYNFLLTFPSLQEGLYRCYHLLEKVPTCKFCGKELYFTKVEYSRTCGARECVNKLNFETKVRNNPEDPYNTKKQKESWKNRTGEQKEAAKLKTRQTCLEKYGVENPNQSEEIKERAKQNCLKKYGVTNVSYLKETVEKRKQTNLKNFGETSVFKTEKFKEDLKKHNLEKYGVEHVGQAEEIKEKIKQTCLEKYGVEYAFQAEGTKENIRQTNLKRYGVPVVTQLSEFKEKSRQTCLKKYGVKYATQNKEVRNKTKETIRKKVEENLNYWRDIGDKRKETLTSNWGTLEDYYSHAWEKQKDTLEKKYGSLENAYKLREEKSQENCLKKLGVKHYNQTKEFREKCRSEAKEALQEFRGKNPSYIPLKDLEFEDSLREFFEQHNVSFNRRALLVEESAQSLGYEIRNFVYKESNIIYKFKGIDLQDLSLEKFLPTFEKEVDKNFKAFLASAYRSEGEKEVYEYIKSLIDEEVYFQSRNIIKDPEGGKLELDIYIPSRKLAIEYNGCYWHSTENLKDKKYHLKKTLMCEKLEIRLIHIWDFEWNYEKEKIKSFLKNILQEKTKVGARKCVLHKLSKNEEKQFLKTQHLQGYKKSLVCYGLFYQNELIQLMSFSKARYRKKVQYELLRLCTKEGYIIIGGAQRLLNAFTKEYSPKSIISYCNREKFKGDVYKELGFKEESLSPNIFYVKFFENSFSKFSSNSLARVGADKLIGTNEGKGSDNVEIVKENGYMEISGVGQQAFLLTF